MNIIKLHEKFKDHDSPSVEGQIRWLQKQGFMQSQIDQAMISVYTDIERGVELYFEGKVIDSGWALDQVLLKAAKVARTKDLTSVIKNIEKFEYDMRNRWETDKKKGFFKRVFK